MNKDCEDIQSYVQIEQSKWIIKKKQQKNIIAALQKKNSIFKKIIPIFMILSLLLGTGLIVALQQRVTVEYPIIEQPDEIVVIEENVIVAYEDTLLKSNLSIERVMNTPYIMYNLSSITVDKYNLTFRWDTRPEFETDMLIQLYLHFNFNITDRLRGIVVGETYSPILYEHNRSIQYQTEHDVLIVRFINYQILELFVRW